MRQRTTYFATIHGLTKAVDRESQANWKAISPQEESTEESNVAAYLQSEKSYGVMWRNSPRLAATESGGQLPAKVSRMYQAELSSCGVITVC